MTDKDIADEVYIEPLTPEVIKKLILKVSPDSLLPTLGGQAALNIAMELDECGFLKEHKVKLIGTTGKTIRKAEDREEFKETMEKIGEPIAPSQIVTNVEDGLEYAQKIDIRLFFVRHTLLEEAAAESQIMRKNSWKSSRTVFV